MLLVEAYPCLNSNLLTLTTSTTNSITLSSVYGTTDVTSFRRGVGAGTATVAIFSVISGSVSNTTADVQFQIGWKESDAILDATRSQTYIYAPASSHHVMLQSILVASNVDVYFTPYIYSNYTMTNVHASILYFNIL